MYKVNTQQMQEYNYPTQSQQKIQKFKTEIRRRNREQYMSKIRTKFLQQEQLDMQNVDNPNIGRLQQLLKLTSTKQNIAHMNKIIIYCRDQISGDLFTRLVHYLKVNFVNKNQNILAKMIELNDLIALLGNLLAFQQYKSIIQQQINFPILVDKLFNLIQNAPKNYISLAFWILFQTMSICPAQTSQRVKQNSKLIIEKIRESDINLSYLLWKMMEYDPKSLQPQIIEQYTSITINKSTCPQLIKNIINILQMFVHENCQSTYIQVILNWIIFHLLSPQFPSVQRQYLFKFLEGIIMSDMDLTILNSIINQQTLLNQLIQRSMFDSYYENKATCLRILNQIVRKSPKLQTQQLIYSFPSIVTTLVQALSLSDYNIVILSLMSIGKLSIQFQNSKQFRNLLLQSRLKYHLQTLQFSKNKQISQFSIAFIEEVLQ